MKRDPYEQIVSYIVENQEKFYRLAFRYAKNQEDALDIVQNAVCRALDHYRELRNPDAVKTWFYRILVNESLALVKQRKREMPVGDQGEEEIPYYETGFETGNLFEELDVLEPDVRDIIKFKYLEELTLKEISEIMELNLNTVKAKLYRGLKQLKETMQEVEV